MKKTGIMIGMMFGFLSVVSVHAAQPAKVIVEMANVYDKPQEGAAVVGTVPKDTSIAVSNVATNGFYKSRIPSGAIGWVSGNDILAGTPAAEEATPEATPAPTEKQKPVAKRKREPPHAPAVEGDHSRIILAGGMQFLSNTGIPATIPITGSTSGFGGGVEFQFKLSQLFYWAARAEYLFSSSSQVVSAATTQTFKFHTLPVMGGIIFSPSFSRDFRIGVGAYAGIAVMTAMTITQVTGATTGSLPYTSGDLCEYVNLQGSFTLSPGIGLYGETGYRLHSASYPASVTPVMAAFTANFSGIVARLGVEFKL